MAGLTAAGFERKRLPTIKTDIENALKQSFGENIDLRPESVFGQLVGVLALPIAELWEEAENVYLAFDPDYAEGVSLDSLAALTGVTRIPATSTTGYAVLTGTNGTIIPAGAEARNSQTEDVYELSAAVTIGADNLIRCRIEVLTLADSTLYTLTVDGIDYDYTSSSDATRNEILTALADLVTGSDAVLQASVDGNVLILTSIDNRTAFEAALTANLTFTQYASPGIFTAQESGALILPINTLTVIQTPEVGWTAVDNIETGITGRNRESDPELRIRRRESVSFPATATIDSILARLLQVEDVNDAAVYQNSGIVTDVNGVPPQHIRAIVRGGADADIGEVLYQNTAGGIGFHGAEEVTVTSDGGQEYVVKFDRADEVQLYVTMEILTNDDFPPTGEDEIKAAIVEWVTANIGIGDMLKYSRLYTPINSIPGHEVTDLFIGIAASPTGTDSIEVDVDEILVADTVNIIITIGT